MLIKLKEAITAFADENSLTFICESSDGLNVERDKAIDDEWNDALFLNIALAGSISINDTGRNMTTTWTVETGLLRRCKKQTDGDVYWDDLCDLTKLAGSLASYLSSNVDGLIDNISIVTSIDSLDHNDVIVKMTFNYTETTSIC